MTSQPIPFHLTLVVPATTAANSMPDVMQLLPKSFVVDHWSRYTDYADVTTMGSRTLQQLPISTQVEITGHISPYWPNG